MNEEQVSQEIEQVSHEGQEIPEAAQEQAATSDHETESGQEEQQTQADEKKFSQSELDEIIKKRIAKAAAQAERKATRAYEQRLAELVRQPQQTQQQQVTQTDDEPQLEQFEKVQDYVKAMSKWTLQQERMAHAQETEAQRVVQMQHEIQNKAQSVFDLAENEPEFDVEAFNALPVTDPMAYAIMDSDLAPKVMVYLQNNPGEVDRIAKFAPARQAAEIGKIEVKIANANKVKPSNAPAPIKPIGSRGGASVKDPAKMSQAEFEKWLFKR